VGNEAVASVASLTKPPAHCPGSVRAITYYRKAYTASRTAMGLAGAVPRVWYQHCRTVRVRAGEWRDKAARARTELAAWTHYQYAWWDWMPRGWQAIGACETGYGRRPGNFRHNSGTYQGFAGFYHGSWDAFVPSADPKAGPYPSEAYEATPRQQYEVALAIWRRYGLSGWGCRGAFQW
jgi:hypothetical protein